jgi:excisionase family DNA binding protein
MPASTISDIDELPAILTVAQVQQLFGISKITSYNLIRTPNFPVMRFGRAIRISREDLKQWMSTQRGQKNIDALVDAEDG